MLKCHCNFFLIFRKSAKIKDEIHIAEIQPFDVTTIINVQDLRANEQCSILKGLSIMDYVHTALRDLIELRRKEL